MVNRFNPFWGPNDSQLLTSLTSSQDSEVFSDSAMTASFNCLSHEKQGAAKDGTIREMYVTCVPEIMLIRADKTSLKFKNPTCCSFNLGNSDSSYRQHLNHKTIIRAARA